MFTSLVVAIGLLTPLRLHDTSVPPIPPVKGVVVQRFAAPPCPRCAGHRGVTIATTPGGPVVAVRNGQVTFAGQVAGHFFVVVEIAPGTRVTYGWLQSYVQSLVVGTVISAGQQLGIAASTLYLGVRIGGAYVEPLSFLGFGRIHLTGPGRSVVGHGPPSR